MQLYQLRCFVFLFAVIFRRKLKMLLIFCRNCKLNFSALRFVGCTVFWIHFSYYSYFSTLAMINSDTLTKHRVHSRVSKNNDDVRLTLIYPLSTCSRILHVSNEECLCTKSMSWSALFHTFILIWSYLNRCLLANAL